MLESAHRRRAGFTLIELMVVMAIITLTASLMIPSVAEFFSNRKIEAVRMHFTSTFNTARLQSVVSRSPFYVVFFRDGVRLYDAERRAWKADEDFNPETSPASIEGISFDLVFAGISSQDLPPYRTWEALAGGGAADRERGPEQRGTSPAGPPRVSIDRLVALLFDRDGTLKPVVPAEIWVQDPINPARLASRILSSKGSDIPAAFYKKDPPENADIIIWQGDSRTACFIDIQMTGMVKSKVASTSLVKKIPATAGGSRR